jgi:hypothetical protein
LDWHSYYSYGWSYKETEHLYGHYYGQGYRGYGKVIFEEDYIIEKSYSAQPKSDAEKYKSYYVAHIDKSENYYEEPSGFFTSYDFETDTYSVLGQMQERGSDIAKRNRAYYKKESYLFEWPRPRLNSSISERLRN